jgi:putative hemolysin
MENENQHSGSPASSISIPGGTILTDTLLQIFKYSRLIEVYSKSPDKHPIKLINSLLDQLDLKIDIPEDDIANIPEKGPFIAVSNHPFRGIDSMLLYKLIHEKRGDFKILGSHLLHSIEPLRETIIPVNTYETKGSAESSYHGIKDCLNHLKEGHCVAIFPTAEDSKHYEAPKIILDREWKETALKLIRFGSAPILPVYFHGTKARLRHIIKRINPLIPVSDLPAEIVNKQKRTIKIRIGAPISLKEQSEFQDINQFGRYLRARVYSLGSAIETRKPIIPIAKNINRKTEPVAEQVPARILIEEFNKIRPGYELFNTKNYSLVCAPSDVIPNILYEIGRQREITFRAVGEGTNKGIDIDEYDFYYNHLFIWDTDENRLVGAYRIGKGKDILGIYGIKGFYINSLFRIRKQFAPVLSEAIELGRSFITGDYQKKAIPLFLLWKGIMIFLLRHAEYRYLIGPVSISNDLSKFSQSLIVEFIRKHFFDEKLARNIIPRKDFVLKPDKVIDTKVFIDSPEKDINKIERVIIDIEPGYRLPILLKKYLEINGKIIGFNIDPKFNDCLDGLMILDAYSAPKEFIQGLSREMNDPSILVRFRVE